MQSPLRFGILGAARIAPKALVVPATQLGTADITRIAARNRDRAESFAEEHEIANVSATYQEVIEGGRLGSAADQGSSRSWNAARFSCLRSLRRGKGGLFLAVGLGRTGQWSGRRVRCSLRAARQWRLW